MIEKRVFLDDPRIIPEVREIMTVIFEKFARDLIDEGLEMTVEEATEHVKNLWERGYLQLQETDSGGIIIRNCAPQDSSQLKGPLAVSKN